MTLSEYYYRLEAVRLREVERQYEAALIGFYAAQAQATDHKGRPYFRTFKDLFDYQKARDGVIGAEDARPDTDLALLNAIKAHNKGGGGLEREL